MEADWTCGVFKTPDLTPTLLRRSAELARTNARQSSRFSDEWNATAERLLAKADDLERNPLAQ